MSRDLSYRQKLNKTKPYYVQLFSAGAKSIFCEHQEPSYMLSRCTEIRKTALNVLKIAITGKTASYAGYGRITIKKSNKEK